MFICIFFSQEKNFFNEGQMKMNRRIHLYFFQRYYLPTSFVKFTFSTCKTISMSYHFPKKLQGTVSF